jgi:hypothetical protein
MRKFLLLVGLVASAWTWGWGIAGHGLASAQEYKEKNLTIIVGYSPGSSFDLYARVIARHIGKYLPGNPTRIVENMTGAGGIIAANHLYNRVKPDGLTIGAWASPLVLQYIMGNEAARFDGRKFGYLGIPSPYDTVCTFNQQSGIVKMEDWINAKRPQKISAIGPGTSTSGISKDRLEALQRNFMRALKDPDLLAEAKRSQLDIDPVDGPSVAKTLISLYNFNPATVARLKDILLPKRR